MTTQTSDVILERMKSLHPKVMDLTLERVWQLLQALNNPQDKMPPVIHVAGTNGKGSTLAMIRAGVEGAGKTAHAYTSPHLARFHERIRVAGQLIEESDLTAVLDECYLANGGDPITYFEITTCAGLLAFSRIAADFTLLEVGLGGRLDATNVCPAPCLTVITPVSIDHEQYLGDTIAKIAFEKAGILKRGVPCIVGPQDDEALDVIEQVAERVGAPLLVHGQHWTVNEERGRLVYQDETGLRDLPLPNLPGAHQIKNAGAALAVLRYLRLGDAAYEAAVTQAEWPARMQRLNTGLLGRIAPEAELWLDGGHNAAAGQALRAVLKDLSKRPTFLICGMPNTKDATGYLQPLAEQAQALIAVAIPGEENSLPAEELAAAARRAGLNADTADSFQDGLRAIVADHPEARILICGSLYLAGEVLRENE